MAKSQLFKPRCSGSTRTAACSRCAAASTTRRRSSPRTRSSSAAARSSCTSRAARSRTGQLADRPRRGIGRLALDSGAPVLPVAIHGSSHVRNWKRLQFPQVTVTYGDLMRFDPVVESTHDQQMAVAQQVFSAIKSLYDH